MDRQSNTWTKSTTSTYTICYLYKCQIAADHGPLCIRVVHLGGIGLKHGHHNSNYEAVEKVSSNGQVIGGS